MVKSVKKQRKKQKKVFITGASGFLGYHLCKYFLKKGWKVIGADIAPFDYDIKNKIEFYQGDIRDKKLVEKIIDNANVIIHAAAALPLWNKKEIFDINVRGTKILLDIAYKKGIKRFIFISSTSVYGIPKNNEGFKEDSPLRGVGPYGESKIEAEKVCKAYRKKGLIVTIIRPKTFAGPYRLGVFQILCDWVLSGKNIPIIGNGKNKYQLLHVYDLVEVIYKIAIEKNVKKINDTFNVGALQFGTLKEDLQALLDYAGFGKKVVCIPAKIAIPILKILEKLKLSPLYEWVYETAYHDHYVDISKITKVLKWKPKYSSKDVWIDTYKWYKEHYKEYIGKKGVSHRVPWDQKILKFVKLFF